MSSGASAERQRQQLQSSLTCESLQWAIPWVVLTRVFAAYAQSCKLLGIDVGNLTITATPNSISPTATGCVPDVTNIFPTNFPFV